QVFSTSRRCRALNGSAGADAGPGTWAWEGRFGEGIASDMATTAFRWVLARWDEPTALPVYTAKATSISARGTIQHKHLPFGRGFRVVLGDRHSQAAQMTLAPGRPRAARTTATGAPTSGSTW